MTVLLKNGHVVDYKNNLDDTYDILIKNEKIEKIGKELNENVDKEIDCTVDDELQALKNKLGL